ncbi:hypothetical protein QT21_00170, partial [Staphylococcus aureus]
RSAIQPQPVVAGAGGICPGEQLAGVEPAKRLPPAAHVAGSPGRAAGRRPAAHRRAVQGAARGGVGGRAGHAAPAVCRGAGALCTGHRAAAAPAR